MAERWRSVTETPGRVTFRKSGRRQGLELGVGCLAAIGFAAVGLAMATTSAIAIVMFGFFSLFAAVSTVAAARHGTDLRLAEIEPAGLWLPEMGFLRWSDIAEVRLESMRGIAGDTSTRRYRRMGVVPRDPTLRPDPTTRAAWGLLDVFVGLLRRSAQGVRVGDEDLAPFGASELELAAPDFDALLESVRRHAEVIDADRERALAHAPRWQVGTLAASGVGPPSGPSATFVAAVAPRDLRSAMRTLVAPVVVAGAIWIVLPAAWFDRLGTPGLAVAVVAVALWLAIGARRMARHLWAPPEAPRPLLRIGPDGIWLPEMGQVGWERVASVRTERAGVVRSASGPAFERWRLVVVPAGARDAASGASFGVTSDLLSAGYDDVLDLVRIYHPVEEGG